MTSRHHRVTMKVVSIKPNLAVRKLSPWNQHTSPVVIVKAPIAAPRGQGLRSTMW